MSVVRLSSILRVSNRASTAIFNNGFHTSNTCNIDQNWRKQKGLPANPNAINILANNPDYSFKDGRPTPYGARHMKRIHAQREYAEKIIKCVQEIDYAVERHAKLEEEKRLQKQKLLENRLKPKGKLYKPLNS